MGQSVDDWSARRFMVQKDKSSPDIRVFITDGSPLRDEALTTGEVAVATGLITLRRCLHGFNAHRYIPITIFSASDRRIRIVQIYHDRETPQVLYVRKSRIMEFWDGQEANRKDWTTLLCWMMGDVVKVK